MKMHTNRHQKAKFLPSDTFLSHKNAQKCVCGRGSALDSAGVAHNAPPDPLAGNGGGPTWEAGGKRRGGEGKVGMGRER